MRRRLRIIVADDDRDTVLSVSMLLRDEGHEVRGFHQTGDALRAITDFDPDAVLLDINMPDVNGFSAAAEIRRRHGRQRPLLIAITGVFTKGSDRLLTQLNGFDHHLVKPYGPTELLGLIEPLQRS